MRGGYPNVSFEDLAEIARVIEESGLHLESHHQTSKKYISHEENIHNKKHETIIHDRDYEWMKEAESIKSILETQKNIEQSSSDSSTNSHCVIS